MGMEEGVEYIVRVTAKNESGLGEPREKVIAGRDPTEVPTLNTSDYPDLNVYLQRGNIQEDQDSVHWKAQATDPLEEARRRH